MKKVLFYIYSLNKGGAERVLLTLAEKLNKKYEVVILTDVFEEREYAMPEGIRRIDLGEYMTQIHGAMPGALKRILAIRKCCKKENPDRVVAFMIASSMRALMANVCTRYDVITAVRSNPYAEYGSFFKHVLVQALFSRAEKIVCQTPYQTEYFRKGMRKKCVVIPNPLFADFMVEPFTGERRKEIVSSGRLYDYKNHKLLIQAFARIADEFKEYYVTIRGEGPYRKALEKEIERLGLQERVFLPGDSSTVAADIREAALFVLPSDTEGMPNALMEAMALGLAVISTDCPCGGPKSLIEHGVNGLLCEVGNAQDMAEQMRLVLRDGALREKLGENALSIKEKCHVDKISENWSRLIDGE